MTVNELVKLLDTEEEQIQRCNRKARELNISINGKFYGRIESAELDGHGDGLVTEVTLNIVAPEEYYEQNKVIEELRDKICSHFADWQYSEDDRWIKDIIELASESVEKIAERMKEVWHG